MSIKQQQAPQIFLTIVILIASYYSGYSISILADTSFKDTTGTYIIRMPSPSSDLEIGLVQAVIIPIDSIGKKQINWNVEVKPSTYYDMGTPPFTEEDEVEFEKGFLKCTPARDSAWMKTTKTKTYCRRRAGGDAAAGFSIYEMDYIGFTREDKLIILAFVIRWAKCSFYEDEVKCKEIEKAKGIRIDTFLNKMVTDISFKPNE